MIIVEERQLCIHKGLPVTLQRLEDDPMQFCIQYAGNGHYFPCEVAALAYAAGRGWIVTPWYSTCPYRKEA